MRVWSEHLAGQKGECERTRSGVFGDRSGGKIAVRTLDSNFSFYFANGVSFSSLKPSALSGGSAMLLNPK